MSVSKDLGDYKTVINNFEEHFFNLFHKYQLNMTLKVHIVLHHYQYYFETTGETFKETNGEFTETAHSTLRKEEEEHNMKIVRKVGSPIHQYKSLKVLTLENPTKIGGNLEGIRKKYKKSSPLSRSLTSSPLSLSSPEYSVAKKRSPFDQKFIDRYPAAIAAHNKMFNK